MGYYYQMTDEMDSFARGEREKGMAEGGLLVLIDATPG